MISFIICFLLGIVTAECSHPAMWYMNRSVRRLNRKFKELNEADRQKSLKNWKH
jgi:hypothetical protein